MERKGDHQKLKMLYLVKIFTEETDDNHALTMAQIIEKLNSCGVNADLRPGYQRAAGGTEPSVLSGSAGL